MTGQQVTMSLWAYPLSGAGTMVMLMRGSDLAAQSFGLEWLGNNSAALYTRADTTNWLTDGGATLPTRWSHITGIISGTNKYLYVNGQLKASNTFSGSLYDVTLQPLWIGAQNRANYNYWYRGRLDEVRISSLARSSNWVWAEFMTVASNVVFSSYGAVKFYVTSANPGVTVSAGGSPLVGFKPLAVQLTATGIAMSGAPLSYAWDFGDGTTSTDQNPAHTYGTGGRYPAQVTASDGLGYTNTAAVPVPVLSSNGWSMQTVFTGYAGAETLTNFPALVVLGTNLAANGFSYNQVASSNGWDLVFSSADWTQPLNYEI